MLLGHRETRLFEPLASMTNLMKGSVALGTTLRGQITRGLAREGYQEMTPVMRYSATIASMKAACAGGSKHAGRFGESRGMSSCLSSGRQSLPSSSRCVAWPRNRLNLLRQVDALEITRDAWK